MPREIGSYFKSSYSAASAEKKLKQYKLACARFSWEQVRAELGCHQDGWMNIAHAALERHAAGCQCNHIALRSLAADGSRRELTYCNVTLLADKFATVLRKLGLEHGDRMFIMGPSSIEMYVAIFGALQNGTVVAPLHSNLGLGPIATRIGLGKGKVLVTTPELYNSKIAELWRIMPSLEHVILIGYAGETSYTLHDFEELMDVAPSDCVLPNTKPNDPAFLHFATDKTGRLIPVLQSHSAMLAHYVAGKHVFQLKPSDVFWCLTDLASKTGVGSGVLAPFLHGATCLIDEAEFDPVRCYSILQDEKVNIWLTSPSVLQFLKTEGTQLVRHYDLLALRHISCEGGNQEDLTRLSQQLFGQLIYKTGWMTETGRLLLAAVPGLPFRPDALGLPLPGVEACIVRRSAGVEVEVVHESNTVGELAIRCSCPDLLYDLLHDSAVVLAGCDGNYYLTGLTAYQDQEGYFFLKKVQTSANVMLEKTLPISLPSELQFHAGPPPL
jgi:acetyl-CoA synthetase